VGICHRFATDYLVRFCRSTQVTNQSGGFHRNLYSVWRDCKTLPWCKNSTGTAESIAIIGNVILNLFATGYIVTRLLIHRRKLIYLYGQQFSISQHNSIVSILLESSVINAPIAIIAVVQLYTPAFGTNFLPLVLACQVSSINYFLE
jgi:hypothetical protein